MSKQGMQFGVNENGRRVKPFKNGRSTCPLCNNILIAHCGDINAWHWQHYNAVDCDSWKEPETAWHLNWKAKWVEAEREVIIQKEGKKHIADVQNSNGIVIEFQNSPISMSTIKARETFYGKMFWVINAKNFVEHLNIWSLVTKELKELDEDYRQSAARDSYYYKTEMEEFEKKISRFNSKIKNSGDQLRSAKFHMESNIKTAPDIGNIAAATIQKWENIKTPYEEANYFSQYGITDEFKQFRAQRRTQKVLAAELAEIDSNINKVNTAPVYRANGLDYRILGYQEIISLKAAASIAIPVHEQHSMFPVFNAIRSPEQLLSYQNKQAGFLFAVDPSLLLQILNIKREKNISKTDENTAVAPDHLPVIIARIKAYYDQQYEITKKNYDGWVRDVEKYEIELEEVTNEKNNFYHAEEIIRDSADEENERQRETDRLNIMKRWKGLYGFRWKNERKSWSETGCPVFFDIGKDYLFQRVEANTLKKVSLSVFLTKYNPQQAE